MGPMFSALIIAFALLVLLALAFIFARAFLPTIVAFRAAAIFVAGVVVGISLSVAALAVLFGGGTLSSTAQVVAYLSALGCGGLFVGALGLWASIKLRVLNLRSSSLPPVAGTHLRRAP